MNDDEYALLDSGDGRKLERFGRVVLSRPCAQAVWKPTLSVEAWARADATFDRTEGNQWHNRGALPDEWTIRVSGITFRLSGTDFGHLGIFPEQRAQWQWIRDIVQRACAARGRAVRVLNLFAYSGGSTLAAALGGAEVCHLDASKGMVQWARDNARLNGLEAHPIRWITDDAHKFLCREVRRERRYDAVISGSADLRTRPEQRTVQDREGSAGDAATLSRVVIRRAALHAAQCTHAGLYAGGAGQCLGAGGRRARRRDRER
ncbi:MAG: class I SAM-dependent methyltransferase [Kiritimatiellia bacterium]